MRSLFTAIIALLPICINAQVGYVQEGNASYYGDNFEGRVTASGERYSHLKATCAHVSIPFGSLVKITNLDNNQTAIARVNDRGPFVPDRIIDVSKSVAERLGMIGTGIARVRIEVVDNQGIKLNSQEEVSKTAVTDGDKKTTNLQTTEIKTNQQAAPSEAIEYFSVEVQKQTKKGFYVQLGSFREQTNIFLLLADAQEQFGKKTCVQVVAVNNDRLFKLLIGPFTSRSDAEKVKQSAQTKYPGCFIVEAK
ncbi:MAG: septal ring lytic transglycosylase RlpA family protein [Tenuifilum sp.]|uniref:septal ring lytic transglycosylase RlpA family protein n=1 Tax=Tenuifilum sp. TaxID=2760880 RepID=UPI001B46C872|nr:septal ring lytic transglycosylase RlpA family protein [Bacteroidales bacterium]HOK60217.1 septal ring lytic transglycosylase RlpA family protein [Tenuifilum sp.]MBP9028907.1 septal ring lytic transglycosylase RlpA family protein [Bacteroidales bacterium]HOK85097.1 septal ring lytic transglycosylase RlpA family protein [Tenuifilum sp.]HON70142.1 septal ring lytic transglycosylase RlpA family protein [Tenuifilum sp.]